MKCMLPAVIIATALTLTAAGVSAVDRVPRPTPVSDTTDRLSPVVPAEPTEQAKPDATKPADKYDTFVDQNGNGVDDRQENLVAKEKSVQTVEPVPEAPKDSSEKK